MLDLLCFTGSPPVTSPNQVETVTLVLVDGSGNVVNGGMSVITFNTVIGQSSYFPDTTPGGLTFIPFAAGTGYKLRATSANGLIKDSVNSFTVVPNSPTKLVLLAPGMTYDSRVVGGTPTVQTMGTSFPLTVIQTDNWFNMVTAGAQPLVTITSAQDLVTLPPASPLVGGQGNFPVTIMAVKTDRKFTATAASGRSPSNEVTVHSEGPDPEEVFPFPSPYNPNLGAPMKFRFQLNDSKTVTIIVKDRFGQDVWRTERTGARGQTDVLWDGRNENGQIVAAGVYNVFLEIGKQIKSKKRFGVVK
jgi:hypothetical protein